MTLDQLTQPRPPAPAANSEATAVEQARAVAEVAAAVKVAQEFPRDISRAVERMRQACSQKALADRAFYSLPRAGGRVEGSTVHLARELAGCWGNIDHGVRELRRDDDAGVSEVIAWAWDQEVNVRSSRSFIVPHEIMVGKGADKKRKRLLDIADVANNNNSVAARAVREAIWHVLPVWYRDEAERLATETLNGGAQGKTQAQQVADAVGHFAATFNVTQGQLEERLGRPSREWTAQDLGYLRVLAGELSRNEKRVEDEFPKADKAITAADLTVPAATSQDDEPTIPEPGGSDDPWSKA
jgi:hypothetical protein